jgi:hypothetical protein
VTETTVAGSTTAPVCVAPPLIASPGVECLRKCCTGAAGSVSMLVTMDLDYNFFDCPRWLVEFTNGYELSVDSMVICDTYRGSSKVRVEVADTATADHILSDTAVGNQGVTGLRQVDDLTRSTSASVPQPFNIWIVVGACIAGAGLVLAIILVIYFCCQRRKENSSYSQLFYVPMEEKNQRASEAAMYRPTPAKSRRVRLVVVHDVMHQGEGVLQCREGDILECDPEDWETAGEWVWAARGLVEGYVPVSFTTRFDDTRYSSTTH